LPYLDSCGEDYKVMILPDHPTPIVTRTHAGDPVPFMIYHKNGERESGVAEQDRMASDGGLYSRMQYLQARAGWFTSLPMKQNVERMGRAQLLRELVHLLGEIYSLQVDRYRAELHRTAALGALLGIMTEGQNRKASEFFTQLRQERQE
ncbi:MAG: hypothetical protein II515_03050, partial [Desulfovibrio sp.]|nr:hypothetical protein [Desulfovibrio sp.]